MIDHEKMLERWNKKGRKTYESIARLNDIALSDGPGEEKVPLSREDAKAVSDELSLCQYQVWWLCNMLANVMQPTCPPSMQIKDCINQCERCWFLASLEVAEKKLKELYDVSSDDVDIEAVVKAKICRCGMWNYLPCQPSWRGCPLGRTPPQKPSERHCEDVTPMMWHEALQKKREEAGGKV